MVKRLPTMWETWVRSLGWEDPLEKEMATHSSILAWKIPRTEEPGRLQSTGSQRVRHDWATSLSLSLKTDYWSKLYPGVSVNILQGISSLLSVSHGSSFPHSYQTSLTPQSWETGGWGNSIRPLSQRNWKTKHHKSWPAGPPFGPFSWRHWTKLTSKLSCRSKPGSSITALGVEDKEEEFLGWAFCISFLFLSLFKWHFVISTSGPFYLLKVKVAQSCPTLCDPIDCSPQGSSVHGILQARILEWVAVPFSKGSSQPRDWIHVSHTAGRFFIVWATSEAPEYWNG